MGMVYREIKQAIIDIEKMFEVLSRNPEVKDIPDAVPLVVSSGNVRFDDVRFSYDAERPILKGLSFEVPGRQDGRDRRSLRRRQVDDLAAAVSPLRRLRRQDPDRRPGHP